MENIKIGIAAICKNEEHYIQNFIDYHRSLGFDNFIIVDTGSTDVTVDLLKSLNIPVFVEQFENISFAVFRNSMWKNVLESNLDYVIVLDIDERIIDIDEQGILNFLKENLDKWAFDINRQDIAGGNDTNLKRILRVKPGFWVNSVHEHFNFYENNNLFDSPVNVLHLNSERIRSRTKLDLYHKLCNYEYSNNKKIDYLFFKLMELFNSTNTEQMMCEWEKFKIADHDHNFFLEMIFSIFYRYSVLLNDASFENDVMSVLRSLNFTNLETRLLNFKDDLNKCGIVEFKTNKFDFLGKPNKTILTFKRTDKDDQLLQLIQPLLDKLIRYGITNNIEIGNKIVVQFNVRNDIIFNKIYFSNLVKIEKINIFKFCAKNNILREMYYE